MYNNFDVVPMLFKRHTGLAIKMFRGFFRMARARAFPRANFGFPHMRNLALVYLKLTPLCNLSCVMCGQYGTHGAMKDKRGTEGKTILPLDKYISLVDDLAPSKPIVYVWGGEPFLYPDLIPLARHAVEKGLFWSVNTNGTHLSRYAEEIVRDKWSSIFVSLDGPREVNDKMRGDGTFDKVMEGIAAVNREKKKRNQKYPIVGIVTTVTNMNYRHLYEFKEAARDWALDVHMFNLGTYTNGTIAKRHDDFMRQNLEAKSSFLDAFNTGFNEDIDGSELYNILCRIHGTKWGHPVITVPALNPAKITEYYHELEKPVRNHCVVPWCQANINYNGDVHFCADYPDYILGNIKDASFKEIFEGERANKFRKTLDACEGGMFPCCLRCYQNMLFGGKIKGY